MITVEGLGKSYLIGHNTQKKSDLLSEQVGRAIKSAIRSTRNIIKGEQIIIGDELEEFWALRDISFQVAQGERIGIIGRNGAGKSTLLKLLSRITEPSEGRITLRGRVASLLEVGTGFHRELSGRENIFLNGSILGMSRKEIKAKFDEIVAFAEVDQFIDTPVKRYSSGMYVRLAFAVAAHLEPEILVVDEVLAVGDAEFQKKCLGKMKDVSEAGRTVLFVSHNMGAIKELCTRGILLKSGHMALDGSVDDVISAYITEAEKRPVFEFKEKDAPAQLLKVRFLRNGQTEADTFDLMDEIHLEFTFRIDNTDHNPGFGFTLYRDATPIFQVYSLETDPPFNDKTGVHRLSYILPKMLLKEGIYSLSLGSWGQNLQMYYNDSDTPTFEVFSTTVNTADKAFRKNRHGHIISPGKWKYNSSL